MWQKIDLWILDNIFQQISDWVWRIAPINCFNLARFCLILHCVWFCGFNWLFAGSIFLLNFPSTFVFESHQNSKFLNSLRSQFPFPFLRLSILVNSVVINAIPPYRLIDVLQPTFILFIYFCSFFAWSANPSGIVLSPCFSGCFSGCFFPYSLPSASSDAISFWK